MIITFLVWLIAILFVFFTVEVLVTNRERPGVSEIERRAERDRHIAEMEEEFGWEPTVPTELRSGHLAIRAYLTKLHTNNDNAQ